MLPLDLALLFLQLPLELFVAMINFFTSQMSFLSVNHLTIDFMILPTALMFLLLIVESLELFFLSVNQRSYT